MSVFSIKVLALSAMIIDHMGYLMQRTGFWSDGAIIFRHIGRLAFPLYAFLVGIGSRHTKDIKKYLLRLLIFAFLSEIPFNMFQNLGEYNVSNIFLAPSNQNVFFTLFLGALAIGIFKYYNSALVGFTTLFALATIADFIHSDYNGMGVLLIGLPIIFCNFIGNKFCGRSILPLLLCMIFILYLINIKNPISYFFAATSSLFFVLLYNGQKGKSIRWLFYMAYPLHLILFYSIWFVFLK